MKTSNLTKSDTEKGKSFLIADHIQVSQIYSSKCHRLSDPYLTMVIYRAFFDT